MAYYPRYEATYSTDQNQTVSVQILKKDVEEDVEQFTVGNLELNDSTEDNVIIARELTLTIFSDEAIFTWETLLADNYDEWMITVILDGFYVFRGFVVPEEGEAPLYDQPYDVVVRATSGLKLLKGVPLTDLNGDNFTGKPYLHEILVAALQKTLLGLPIRLYGSWYTQEMNNRATDPQSTYWNQARQDYRGYQSDATNFIDCYETIIRLISRHSRLFYYNDMWVVFIIGEYQYVPGGLYYTDLDNIGNTIGGAEDTEGYATVGKAEAIYPIDEAVMRKTSFPVKFAKTTFNYNQFPEFPLNSKFERGTFIERGRMTDEDDEDDDGNRTEDVDATYESYTIDDFLSGTYQGNPTEYANLPSITVGNPDAWYSRKIFNGLGIEVRRDVVIERGTAAGGRFIQTTGEPVNKGDRIRFSFDWKTDTDLAEADPVPVQITPYIVDDATGDKWVLRSKDGQVAEVKWEPSTPQMVGVYSTPNAELRDWQAINIESPGMPVNGTLYFMFWSSVQLGDNTKTYYRGFSVEYIPFIVGSFNPVTGDYWKHSSSKNQLDKDDAEIFISDSPIRIAQGTLLKADGVTATSFDWYREGLTESRHFKELANLARYNLGYRRFLRIQGPFTSLMYSPVNNPENIQPIGFHKTYRFVDLLQPRDFILVAPLRMDLCTGNIDAIFEEVYNPALTKDHGADVYEVVNGLIYEVAVTHGIVLTRYPPDPLMLRLTSATGTTITASAIPGSAGNAPSLTVNYQQDTLGYHEAVMTIGSDIEIGNVFTINVDGVPATYTAVSIIRQADGSQTGDSSEFKYIFSNR